MVRLLVAVCVLDISKFQVVCVRICMHTCIYACVCRFSLCFLKVNFRSRAYAFARWTSNACCKGSGALWAPRHREDNARAWARRVAWGMIEL